MADRPLTILFMPESAYGPTNQCIGIGDVRVRVRQPVDAVADPGHEADDPDETHQDDEELQAVVPDVRALTSGHGRSPTYRLSISSCTSVDPREACAQGGLRWCHRDQWR